MLRNLGRVAAFVSLDILCDRQRARPKLVRCPIASPETHEVGGGTASPPYRKENEVYSVSEVSVRTVRADFNCKASQQRPVAALPFCYASGREYLDIR